MHGELQEIKDAWDNRPAAGEAGSGPDGFDLAQHDQDVKQLARNYVAAHASQFEALKNLTEDQCVEVITVLRDDPSNSFAGALRTAAFGAAADEVDADEQWFLVQVWLWNTYAPKEIGGVIRHGG